MGLRIVSHQYNLIINNKGVANASALDVALITVAK